MLKGIRWQLLALVMAAVLFTTALLSRTSTPPPVSLTSTPLPEATLVIEPTPTSALVAVTSETAPLAVPVQTEVFTYREALIGRVQRLNPLYVSLNPVDRDITALIYEGLFSTSAYGEPVPQLASTYVISSDGLEYVVTLRSDVLWQDGVPFTADDVSYTMSILRSPDFMGESEVSEFWRTVETEQLGPYLVRFRLTQPLSSFLNTLRIGILPEHVLRGTTAAHLADHPFNLAPIGTGPYQIEALRSENDLIQQVDLRRAPAFQQRTDGQSGYQIERISFHLYDTFDAAVAAFGTDTVDAVAARSRLERFSLINFVDSQIYTSLEDTLGVIVYNWTKDETRFFREQRVRLALAMGLDRTGIVQRHLLNQAALADSPILPGSWAYVGGLVWPTYDPAGARSLLDTVNLRRDTDEATPDVSTTETGILFSFNILTSDDPALAEIVREVAAQWSQFNIVVGVEAVDSETYQARLEAGEFDAVLVELSLGENADPDVYSFWHQGQYPEGENYGGVNDRRISEFLERARRDPNGINRSVHYRLFQEEFVERAIAVPLYYPLYTFVTHNRVSGVQLGMIASSVDRFRNIRDWTVSE